MLFPIDDIKSKIDNSVNDVTETILKEAGFDLEYVKEHPDEFHFDMHSYNTLFHHVQECTLVHNNIPIGIWRVITSIDSNEINMGVYVKENSNEH